MIRSLYNTYLHPLSFSLFSAVVVSMYTWIIYGVGIPLYIFQIFSQHLQDFPDSDHSYMVCTNAQASFSWLFQYEIFSSLVYSTFVLKFHILGRKGGVLVICCLLSWSTIVYLALPYSHMWHISTGHFLSTIGQSV